MDRRWRRKRDQGGYVPLWIIWAFGRGDAKVVMAKRERKRERSRVGCMIAGRRGKVVVSFDRDGLRC